MKISSFGMMQDGRAVSLYTLENNMLRASFSDYGATLVELFHKEKGRHLVLGYDNVEGYIKGHGQLGATVGRVANRIAQASYTWQGKVHQLESNNGPNLLHSGKGNIGHRLWDFVREEEPHSLVLSHRIRSEEDGFPGHMDIQMEATLEGNRLILTYAYKTSTDSFVNITNHSYFNLKGTGTIESHRLQLGAEVYMPFGDHQIPLGHGESVVGTAFDFTKGENLGHMLEIHREVLAPYGGYDHDFLGKALDHIEEIDDNFVPIAQLEEDALRLIMYSDAPHFQVYTGNWLDGRGREKYEKYSGIAIEPQFVPDDIHSEKKSMTIANTVYERRIAYEIIDL